jgi:hypothetical protein
LFTTKLLFITLIRLILHFAASSNGNKPKLDTKKAAKATVAVTAFYGFCLVSEGTEYPQLTVAIAIALIVIIVILYGPRLAPKAKKITPPAQE